MKIFRHPDKFQVLKEATNALNNLLEERKNLPTLLLLSGGSALNLLVGVQSKNLGPHLTIGMLDERYSKDSEVNNFARFRKTKFYRRALEAGPSFIDTRIQGDESLDEFAKRFENELRNWVQGNPEGMVISTQGVGIDGHTAGIMPYPENPKLFKNLFENNERWAVGYDATSAKNKYPLRVTVTIPFLQNVVDVSIVYVSGDDKLDALNKILSPKGTLWETPARIIRSERSIMMFTNLPQNLRTKIFLDGGDPEETKEIISLLVFLDGQTTNPTLLSKNPQAEERIEHGEKFAPEEIIEFYQKVVKEISGLIPDGSVSVETYADHSTTAEDLLKQGREMFSWIPNAHIKYPTTKAGLIAAERSIKEGIRVNMTLCFSQEQAAAVYAATRGASKGQVFVSPFVGRLDNRLENGMGLVKNIIEMYKKGDGHVEVLTASVRNIDHLLCAIQFGSDIVTAPFKILKEWGEKGMPVPDNKYRYNPQNVKDMPYKDIDITKRWQEFDIAHELTEQGMERFSQDWNQLVK